MVKVILFHGINLERLPVKIKRENKILKDCFDEDSGKYNPPKLRRLIESKQLYTLSVFVYPYTNKTILCDLHQIYVGRNIECRTLSNDDEKIFRAHRYQTDLYNRNPSDVLEGLGTLGFRALELDSYVFIIDRKKSS